MNFTDRFKEPSSWGGLAAMLLAGSSMIPDGFTAFGLGANEFRLLAVFAAVVTGILAVVLHEKGGTDA